MLWWLETIIKGNFFGIGDSYLKLILVPKILRHCIKKKFKISTLFLCLLYPNKLKHIHCIGWNVNKKRKNSI